MSFQTFCGKDPNDAATYQKLLGEFMEGGANVAQGLGSVLQVSSSAFVPNTTTKQDATDFDTLGCVKIETGIVGQGNNLSLVVGEAGDNLQIKGATLLGSLLVGNGANTESLPVGANGLVLKANSNSITGLGVEWAVDGTTGITGVSAGTNIGIDNTNPIVPIINFATPTTADIQIGVGHQIIAKDNYATPNFAMSIDATGLNDEYSNGAVLNKEDIAVSATDVVQTISATDGAITTSVISDCDHTICSLDVKYEDPASNNLVVSSILKSQLNQTTYLATCDDSTGTLTTTRQDATILGAMLDTHSVVDTTTSITTQRTEQTSNSIGCNQILQYTNPASIQVSQTQNTSNLGATYQAITEDFPFGANHKGAFAFSSTNAQGEVSALYEDFAVGAVYQGTGNTICNAGGSSMTITSANVSTGNSKLLRMETPSSGDALIEHIAFGGSNLGITTNQNLSITADNIDLSTAGRLILPSLASADRLDYNAGTLALKTDNVGYLTDDLLLLENTNATAGNTTGVPSLEMYKSGRNGALNDVVSTILFNAKDGAGVKRTFSKIESSITTNTAPANYDGSLDFYSLINGVNNLVFRLNGADNENNSFRPLDLNGNDLKTTTGDMLITSTASTGTGNIGINAKGSITLTPVAGSNLLNGNTTIQAAKTLSLSKSALIVSTQVLNGESIVNNDNTNGITATLDTKKLVILDTPNNTYGDYRKNYIAVFDNTNNQNIQIDNQTATQNRIDFFVNSGGGITTTSGIVNTPSGQSVFMNYQDNANGRSLQLNNDSASGGILNYTNQISPLQPFTIDSSTGELILKTIAGQALTLNSDILNLANTNTTTTANAHNADIRTTSTGVSTNTFLKLQLNGTDIWVPYFTTDPSL